MASIPLQPGIAPANTCACAPTDPDNLPGIEYAREGRLMMPVLFPLLLDRRATIARLRLRVASLLRSSEPSKRNVGFFLHGIAEAMEAHRG